MRFFNTAGPVESREHYCLPLLERFDLDTILSLIAQKNTSSCMRLAKRAKPHPYWR